VPGRLAKQPPAHSTSPQPFPDRERTSQPIGQQLAEALARLRDVLGSGARQSSKRRFNSSSTVLQGRRGGRGAHER
jgi:hypothetical protein